MAQVNYFIATNGSDKNSGSLQKPFKTILAAINKVILLKDKTVKIYIRKGNYYLDTTIVLDAAISQFRSLSIESYKKEAVLILGSRIIKPAWQPYKGNIVQAKVLFHNAPDVLYRNGVPLHMARYPNFDAAAKIFNGTSSDAISKDKVAQWKNPAGGYVHALHEGQWGGFHYLINGKTDSNTLLLEGGWQNNRPSAMNDRYRFAENIFEELDAPDEWYYDGQEKEFYYYNPSKNNPVNTIFTVSELNGLIVLKGNADKPLKNICIRNIQFAQTSRTFMLTREPLLRSDWVIYRGGAILLDGTENVSIENCTFSQLGGNAVFVSNYNKQVAIMNNHIHDIGGNAICFVGSSDAVRSPAFQYSLFVPFSKMDFAAGPKTNNYPQNCTAAGNLIHDIGQIEKQVAGVEIDIAEAISVEHNTIYNLPRAGINIGDGCFGGHRIAYNEVFNAVLETSDHGAFNSWGRDRYWLPERNKIDSIVAARPGIQFLDAVRPIIIFNNRFQCDHGWDIDLDDGSSNYIIENNICLSGGLKLREGYRRIVQNNIIINNSFHPHVWLANSEDVFKHNIVTAKYAPIGIDNNRWGNNIDSNFFLSEKALIETQKNGVDKNSIAGSAGFTNDSTGNYYINGSSRAAIIGYKNVSFDFGVTDPALKAMAKHPVIHVIRDFDEYKSATTLLWRGALLKNIETIGERSAAGLNDDTGVLVTDVKKGSLAEESGLQKGDVIIKIGNEKVRSLKDFSAILDQSKWLAAVSVVLVHNQAEKTIKLLLK